MKLQLAHNILDMVPKMATVDELIAANDGGKEGIGKEPSRSGGKEVPSVPACDYGCDGDDYCCAHQAVRNPDGSQR